MSVVFGEPIKQHMTVMQQKLVKLDVVSQQMIPKKSRLHSSLRSLTAGLVRALGGKEMFTPHQVRGATLVWWFNLSKSWCWVHSLYLTKPALCLLTHRGLLSPSWFGFKSHRPCTLPSVSSRWCFARKGMRVGPVEHADSHRDSSNTGTSRDTREVRLPLLPWCWGQCI